jgi:hypothetical protein
MRMLHVLSILALLPLAPGVVTAQPAPSRVLNEAEVLQLVGRGESADHARLAAHFAALGERAAAQARRHTAMLRGVGRNPNRDTQAGLAAHCRRLADLQNQSADALKALTDHHAALGRGAASAPPAEATRFEQGAGAPEPTDAELEALSAKASTAAEHRALAQFFRAQADRLTRDAATHGALAKAYRAAPRGAAAMAPHCDRLATLARAAATEATAAAAMHEKHAGAGR